MHLIFTYLVYGAVHLFCVITVYTTNRGQNEKRNLKL